MLLNPKTPVMKSTFLVLMLVFMFSNKGISQNDVSISLGAGFPELLNAGVRYEMAPVKFGAGIGTAFTGYVLYGDFYYHFGKLSQFSKMPPWYVRANMTYWQLRKVFFIDLGKVVLLGVRVGRDFNITEEIGVSMDGGIIPFSFFSGKKIPFSFIPSVGLSVYYRFDDMKMNAR
jgi:hypothetical protein